jgi:hypothetical protein
MNRIKLLLEKYNITNYAVIQFIPAIILIILTNYTLGMKNIVLNIIVSIFALIYYILLSYQTNCLIIGKCKKYALFAIIFNYSFLVYSIYKVIHDKEFSFISLVENDLNKYKYNLNKYKYYKY